MDWAAKNVTKRPDLNTITMSLVTGLWELRRLPKKFLVVVFYLLLSSTQIISVLLILYFFFLDFCYNVININHKINKKILKDISSKLLFEKYIYYVCT